MRSPDYATKSVAEITAVAEVGLGSFYNHFTTKAELFEAAVHEVLAEQWERVGALVVGLDDPAEVAAMTLRTIPGLVDTNPEVAEILVTRGLDILDADRALTPQARGIIQRGIESGRFVDADVEMLLAVLGGSLLAALHTWMADPARVDQEWGDALTERLLVTLGVPQAEAAQLAHRPLPEC